MLLAALALAASACGGGDSESVPSGSIAVVDGTEISKEDLDELIAQAKKGYESQKQEFPKAGSPEYQSIQTQYVAYLVELEQFRQAAEELGVSVTDKDVDDAEQELIKSRFDGKRAEYEKALEAQGFTAEQYREKALEVSALSKKIFDEVTKGVKVTEQEILAYYTAEPVAVRHARVARRAAHPDRREGRRRQGRLRGEQGEGGRRSTRSSRAARTSRRSRSRTRPIRGARTRAASSRSRAARPFPSSTRSRSSWTRASSRSPSRPSTATTSSRPCPRPRKATTTPIDKVRATIRATLLQQKRNDEMQAWVEELKADYEGKVSYAAGYEPPELPEAPTETE